MICVPISINSRGSSAFTLAWVPTGMYTGVSTTPCAVVNRPSRALVCASVLSSSNIARRFNQNGALEHEILRLVHAGLRITRHIQQKSHFDEQRPPPTQEHPAAQIERGRQKSHADSDGQERRKQQGGNRGCGGSAFDRQHEGPKQNGQHGGDPLVLKQPDEPGKGGED